VNNRKEEIAANLAEVESRIKTSLSSVGRDRSDVTLIAVTKTFPVEDVLILYELGIKHFGENRDQEGALKAPLLPPDSHWHFQGQIQGNKIASIASWAQTIHSLDSLDHAGKFARTENISSHEYFLQVNLESDAKHRGGIPRNEVEGFIAKSSVPVTGLMVVAPLESNPSAAFEELQGLAQQHGLKKLSMGMSGDFEPALMAGTTHIRVGSSILGSRPPFI